MLVTKVVMPQNKIGIKCPYSMKPEGITIHNTANDASAMSEVSYMINNNKEVSFHYAIDDYRVVQGIEDNRNSWSNGDGHGFGNMKTISIEICYSKSGGEKFEKAERNAAEFLARKMVQYGWGLDKINDARHTIGTHKDRSGKYCPHRTLDMGLERFYDMVREEYRELTGQEAQGQPNIINESNNNTGRNVNDIVTINGVYTSSSATRKLTPKIKTGTITRIIPGARNPYLLNGGNIGWVNDGCIVNNQAPAQSKPVEKPKVFKTIGGCKMLNLRKTSKYGNNIEMTVPAGTQVEYLGMENGWAMIGYKGYVLFCGKQFLK